MTLNISEWSKAQQIIGLLGTLLTVIISLSSIVVWAGDTRWQRVSDANNQSQETARQVNIEQYSYQREALIIDQLGANQQEKEKIEAKIRILDKRIKSLEGESN